MKSNKLLEITEGEYYLFFNFYKNREQITLGYPYSNSPRNDVYLSVNGEEKGRLSYKESNKYLVDAIKNVLPLYKIKGLSTVNTKSIESQKIGFCNNCGKKLRGDITKDLCTECWKNKSKSTIKIGKPTTVRKTLNNSKTERLNTHDQTYELLKQGHSINSIASIRDLQVSTIVGHLSKLNETVPLSNFIRLKPKQEIINRVEEALSELDDDYTLREIFEYLEEEVDFDDIRLSLIFIK